MRIHMVVVSMKNDVSNQNGTLFWKIIQRGSKGRTWERPENPWKRRQENNTSHRTGQGLNLEIYDLPPKIPGEAPRFWLFNLRKKKGLLFFVSLMTPGYSSNFGDPKYSSSVDNSLPSSRLFQAQKTWRFHLLLSKAVWSLHPMLRYITITFLDISSLQLQVHQQMPGLLLLESSRMQTCLNTFIQWALNYDWLTGKTRGRAGSPINKQMSSFFGKFGSTHFCWDGHISKSKARRFFFGFCGAPTGLDGQWMKRSVDIYSNTAHQTPKHVKRKAAFWRVC